ncbi:MAG: SUMF1/EgtB/PvdO family nonheme iron enzyme [Candidatus Saccharimonadaceae bacterium]
MALNNLDISKSPKKRKKKVKTFFLIICFLFGAGVVMALYQTSVYFSTNESCAMCHVHPHAEESWRLSSHVNNKSGVMTNCVDCHLPPQSHTWNHYTAKLRLGARDVWGYLTKDSTEFNWDQKSELEYAVKYIPNESCKKCHQNIFPQGISDEGITAHLYYDENEKKLNLQCISCHLDVGHYNPNYSHSQMAGIPGFGEGGAASTDTSLFFKSATHITTFENFSEKIPNTPISFNMVAIPGGTFKMGSPNNEPFHQADEAPEHNVTVSPFFMAEVETTWNQFWAFYGSTMSEGRTPPETTYTKNLEALDVDGISGPTPPFGFPDQGWGGNNRPAITMTHYAAETFCLWLSKKTGKKYRLPTEAEWEYAARAKTETPYFFPGNPKEFSEFGFWRRIFPAKTDNITSYVIYDKNSNNRTHEPSIVEPNPFGLKNMLGNVMEYCADKYNPKAYEQRENGVTNPLVSVGEEWVVRGGNYASDASNVRSASRASTHHDDWMKTDPQQPKSIWWYSDFKGIGFRVVCEAESFVLNN